MDDVVDLKSERVLLVSSCKEIPEKFFKGIDGIGLVVEAERSGLKALLSISRAPELKVILLDVSLEDMEFQEFLILSRAIAPEMKTALFSRNDLAISEFETLKGDNPNLQYLGKLDDLENVSLIIQGLIEDKKKKSWNKNSGKVSCDERGGGGKIFLFYFRLFSGGTGKGKILLCRFF